MKPSLVSEKTVENYLAAVLKGDLPQCRGIVKTLLEEDVNITDLYGNLFHRVQYTIGELWAMNQISVAKEHLATSITESLMTLIYPQLFQGERSGKRVIVSAGSNQYHQMGGKMVADIFESCGWSSYFLGANTSTKRLLEEIHSRVPDCIAFSVTLPTGLDTLRHTLDAVRTEFPTLPVLVGGKAIADGIEDDFSDVPHLSIMTTLEELESFLKTPEGHAIH